MKRFLVVLLALVAAGSSLGMVLLYRRYSTSRPVVRYAGGELTLKDYRDRLEMVGGRQVLNKMVLNRIIMATATKKGVAPSKEDVDRRIQYIKRRNPAVVAQGTRDPKSEVLFREDLQTDLALENLTIAEIKLTEAEIKQFYDKNKAMFATLQQADSTLVVTANNVDAITAEKLLNQRDSKGKPMFDNGTLARQPRLEVVGMNSTFNFGALPEAKRRSIDASLRGLKEGQVKMVRLLDKGPHQFLIARIDKMNPGGTRPLDEVRKEVEIAAKMQKIGKGDAKIRTMVKTYREAKPEFEIPSYASYLDDIEQLGRRMDEFDAKQGTGAKATAAK